MSAPNARLRLGSVVLLAVLMVASVGWVLLQVDLGRMATALVDYHLGAALLTLLGLYTTLVLRTWRFGVLLRTRVAFGDLFIVLAIGSLAMSVMPLRLGELVRPYVLAERNGVTFGESMAAVVVERLTDIVALLVLMLYVARSVVVTVPVQVMGVDVLRAGLVAVQTGAVVGIGGVAVLVLLGERVLPVGEALVGRMWPSAWAVFARQWRAFVDAVRTVSTDPRRLVGAVVSTAAVWLATVGMAYAALLGLADVVPTWPLAASAWAAVSTAMVLFPAPGFLGGFEAAGVAALVTQGIDATAAAAFAVALHVVMLGGYTLAGFAASVRAGASFTSWVRGSRAQGD
ncbi:MAG: flippase-like domain-containing protein [Alphaproteobacteria bacterium]|nr:flippase-like domain-containing protein [Alphaproteobacteria bacterium]